MRAMLEEKYTVDEIRDACHSAYDFVFQYAIEKANDVDEFLDSFHNFMKKYPYKKSHEIFLDIEDARSE